jgi:hypothetical protein
LAHGVRTSHPCPAGLFGLQEYTRVGGDVSHWVGLSLHWIYAGLQDGDDDKYRFQKNESLEIVCDIHVKEPMKNNNDILCEQHNILSLLPYSPDFRTF